MIICGRCIRLVCSWTTVVKLVDKETNCEKDGRTRAISL